MFLYVCVCPVIKLSLITRAGKLATAQRTAALVAMESSQQDKMKRI